MNPVESRYFKCCSKCDQVWPTSENFIEDKNIKLKGYQVNFVHREKGLLLFNHQSCKTTLSLFAESLMYLFEGPVYSEDCSGSQECYGYCLQETNLTKCTAKCINASVREVMAIIIAR